MVREIVAMKFACTYRLAAAFFLMACGTGPAFAAPGTADGYLKVGFDQLSSFPFAGPNSTAPAAVSEAQIPAAIKKLDGRKVVVTGFLLPIKMDGKDELTTEFLLMKSQLLCCYGIAPQANEWILVEMPKGARPVMDVPISFCGTLHVRAMFESGYLTGIYSLDGERKIDSGG
jgi:hypothetical protein